MLGWEPELIPVLVTRQILLRAVLGGTLCPGNSVMSFAAIVGTVTGP